MISVMDMIQDKTRYTLFPFAFQLTVVIIIKSFP